MATGSNREKTIETNDGNQNRSTNCTSRGEVMVCNCLFVRNHSNLFDSPAQVRLLEGHDLKIAKSDLEFAITTGRLSSGNLNLMINKILESIYSRKYMSEHSLSGLAPRLSKAQKAANVQQGTPPAPTKPGLPNKDVTALTRKCYNLLISQKSI